MTLLDSPLKSIESASHGLDQAGGYYQFVGDHRAVGLLFFRGRLLGRVRPFFYAANPVPRDTAAL